MNYRRFGNTDLIASEIGFGAWAIGGNAVVGTTPIGWGKSDDTTSAAAIHKALDVGINFFDTADFYGLGHSEKLLGKELRNNKEVIIATKVGHRVIENAIQLDYSKNYILQACNESLRRLKTNEIDYYQLHSARMKHFETEECIEAMDLLKKQGKVRYWGLSLNTFHPEEEAEYFIKNNFGSGFQLVFNLINQRVFGVMEEACKTGYGIIVRMPLQFGLLTGKFSDEEKFSKDDHRNFRLTKKIITKSNSTLNRRVWSLCDKYNIGKSSLALSFILSLSCVSTVIPGIRTPQHAIDNTTNIVRLDKYDLDYLREIYNPDWKEVVDLMEEQG
jgi:aryl-alcohol dehydrogenase-like predicted oxidoreductase